MISTHNPMILPTKEHHCQYFVVYSLRLTSGYVYFLIQKWDHIIHAHFVFFALLVILELDPETFLLYQLALSMEGVGGTL